MSEITNAFRNLAFLIPKNDVVNAKPIISGLIILFITVTLFAQNPSIYDPTITPTVTDQQIAAWGHTSPDKSGITVLDFEGLSDMDAIKEFYNGGTSNNGFTGTNYGVSFSEHAVGIISNEAGGSGNFSNNPLGNTVLFFPSSAPYMNVADGFNTELSFYYASSGEIQIEIYDGLNGTGTLLASKSFPETPEIFTVWEQASILFEGSAKSVFFSGPTNSCGFDAITLGQTHAVPVSKQAFLISLSLMLVFIFIKSRRIL